MKMMKKTTAILAATLCASALAVSSVMSVSAADIAYESSGTSAYSTSDDGKFFRLNIYNTWGNNVTDINPVGSFENTVDVTFTISGLQRGYNVDDMGNKTDDYYAYLGGTIGGCSYWGPDGNGSTVENATVPITGDGTYTLSFNMSEPADTVLCLFIQTNINIYQNGVEGATADNCGITCNVDSITTGGSSGTSGTENDGNSDATTTTTTDSNGSADTTTTVAGDTTTTTAAAGGNGGSSNGGSSSGGSSNGGSSNSGSSNNNSSSNNKSSSNNATTSQTGDFGIAAVVLGAVATAALGVGAYTVTRRKK